MQNALINVEEQRAQELGAQHASSATTHFRSVPMVITLAATIALVLHGPLAQYAGYHHFADRRAWLGIPNALDVLSNVGFAVIGAYGLYRLWPRRDYPALIAGWPGFALFLVSLVLTGLGSAFYRLAPDDGRLIWDRLPIALACAGLLAGVRALAMSSVKGARVAAVLALVAVASVFW
jgi:hypothetical protein